jgi:hypothetical protein
MNQVLIQKNNKLLYAIAYENRRYGNNVVYMHGTDAGDIRYQLFVAKNSFPPRSRIVGIAPAIGVFEDQETGKLST